MSIDSSSLYGDADHAGKRMKCNVCGSPLYMPDGAHTPDTNPISDLSNPSARDATQSSSAPEHRVWRARRSIHARYWTVFSIFLLLAAAGFFCVAQILPVCARQFSTAQASLDTVQGFINNHLFSVPHLPFCTVAVALFLTVALWRFAKLLLWSYGQRYTLTTRRLIIEEGIISRKKHQIMLIRVKDLNLQQSIINRLIRVGNVEVISSDETIDDLLVEKISSPNTVFEKLHDVWQKEIHNRGLVMW